MRRVVGGDRACGHLSVSADGGTLTYAASDMLRTPDLYVLASGGEHCLTRLNRWLEERALSQPRPLQVRVDGMEIDTSLLPLGRTEPVPPKGCWTAFVQARQSTPGSERTLRLPTARHRPRAPIQVEADRARMGVGTSLA